MTWELYEVWSETDLGHQALVDTTKSLKEARRIATDTIAHDADVVMVQILRETADGDFELVEELGN